MSKFVLTKEFQEDNLRWKIIYDPYKIKRISYKYKEYLPLSFQKRLSSFVLQKNILDR